MAMPDIVIYLAEDASEYERQRSAALAQAYHLTINNEQPAGLGLSWEAEMLVLKDFDEPKLNGVSVDFLSGGSQYRKQHGGGVKEPIAKAVGVKGNKPVTVIDATPGLGRDAFVLVAVGCNVTLIERSPIVAALLDDGIYRLQNQAPELAEKINLIHGNSIEVLAEWQGDVVDSVYLDPMFPHKKKSALVKKEMRLFQQLLGPDDDQCDLLGPALKVANKRVVVKRPNTAEVLAGQQPSMAITSKKHRFDVYLCQNH